MRGALSLLRWVAFRRLWGDKLRTGVTLLGVALGVGAYLAIHLANANVTAAFKASLDAVAGRTHLQVAAGEAGMDEQLFLAVKGTRGVARATPLLQTTALAPGKPRAVLLVLGVDTLSEGFFRDYRLLPTEGGRALRLSDLAEPDTIFLTRRFAGERGLRVGDTLRLALGAQSRAFTIRGLLAERGAARALGGHLALLDIAAAQEAFGKLGRLDRIDVELEDPRRLEEVRASLESRLPPHVRVERPERRSAQVDKMLGSFQLNLAVLSYIALAVGLFLIYNAASTAVVRRRAEIGTLRGLGLSARAIWGLFLAEGALLGAAGAILGVALGAAMARGALEAMTRTVSNLYSFLRVTELVLPPRLLGGTFLVGVGVATLSSLLPAWEASRVPPARAQAGEAGLIRERSRSGLLALAGGALTLFAYLLARQPAVGGVPLFGYLSAFLILAGTSLLAPGAMRLVAALLRRPIRGMPIALLSLLGFARALRRNAATVAALAVAVAMVVSLVVMVGSFRRTVEVWVEQTIRADLYAAPASRFIKGSRATFAEEYAARVARVPGVADVDAFRALRVPAEGGTFLLGAGDFGVLARRGKLLFLDGNSRQVLERARREGEAVISETFALRFGLGRGDRLRLATPAGELSLRVAGVFYDYATEGGMVTIDRGLYKKHWRDSRLTTLGIYLAPGADRERVRREVAGLFGPRSGMLVFTNFDLRRRVLEVFDQTFTITYALEAIAVLVAVLGVVGSLSANVLERRREFGALRSLGFTRFGLFRIVLGEAGLVATVAGMLGAGAGLALSLVLIHVINKQSFGWTIQFHFPFGPVMGYLAIVLFAALLGGLPAARLAARLPTAEAVRRE
ncbi:MAG: ABC transporter permease [Nitrospinota bacterium]